MADAIARLPEREKLVVALYYYENLTLREIGEVLGVTESRVSQLHTKAVLRLRSRLPGSARLARRSPDSAAPPCTVRHLATSERRVSGHAPCGGQDPQRRAGGSPRQRQDLAVRGAALRGRGHHAPGQRRRRDEPVGRRSRRAGAGDVDLAGAQLVRPGRTARSTCSTRRASRASSPTRSARCACASRRSSSSTR